jgi:tetratricopeptide (TPR) repeat protein
MRVAIAALLLSLVVARPASAHEEIVRTLAESDRRLNAAPSDPQHWITRAELRRLAGDWSGATADLEHAAALAPGSIDVTLCRGAMALDRGWFAEAEEYFDAILEASPGLATVHRLRARARAGRGRPLDAEADWRSAIAESEYPYPDDYAALIRSLRARGALAEIRLTVAQGVERLGPVPYLVAEWRAVAKHEPLPETHAADVVSRSPVRSAAAPAAVLARGPYLQMATSEAITIRWRTDVPTDSRVRFGAHWTQLDQSVDDGTPTTEHEVRIEGLAPQARYFYAIGSQSETVAGGDSTFRFDTPPAVGATVPLRAWIIGDSGLPSAGQLAVRDAYAAYPGASRTDLWLMLGDNAYNNGTDVEYQAAVFDAYPAMLRRSVLWPTRGNHDVLHTGSNNDYYDIFTLPTAAQAGGVASGTEAYYSFDAGNVHFVCLDSQGSDRSPSGAMMTWLREDLAVTQQDWVIAFWHHPPYTKGSHDSDSESQLVDMRENALPPLEQAGVDLVLTGHSHSYERSFLLDEHYQESFTLHDSMKVDAGDGDPDGDGAYTKASAGAPAPHEGAVYGVVGSSSRTSGGSLDHPAMAVSLNVLGSLMLDIEGNRLDAAFLRSTGAVADRFTIVKGAVTGAPASPAIGRALTLAVSPNPSRGDAHLRYVLPHEADVRITVHDVAGRLVATLVEGPRAAGAYSLTWDGADGRDREAGPGVYFVRLRAGTTELSARVVREP